MIKSIGRGSFPLAIFGALLMLNSGGCAENEALVYYIAANQTVDEKSNCELQVGGGGAIRPYGYMDLSLTDEYVMFPLIESGMAKTEEITGKGPKELMGDNSTILILGAIVDYEIDPIIEAELLARTGAGLPQGQFIPSAGSVESNKNALAALQIIPPFVGQQLRQAQQLMGEPYQAAQMLVNVTMEGQLPDGTTVYSNTFVYPITLCNQCLIFYPVDDCTNQDSEPDVKPPCFPGQDDAVDCRFCYILAQSPAEAEKCLGPPQ